MTSRIRKTPLPYFFYFEKPFDTISRRTIIQNLTEMDVNGRMLKFIHNYLSKITLRMKIGNPLLESYNTTAGVPQGGVLSAIYFIIAINNILNPLPRGVEGSLSYITHPKD